jgi:hypothetical protein
MEPSGRNQWQAVENRPRKKSARSGQNRCRGLRAGAAEMHGKEGVGGSSPPEGFRKFLLISSFLAACGDCVDTGSPPSVLVTAASLDRG